MTSFPLAEAIVGLGITQPDGGGDGAGLLDQARTLLTTYCALPSPQAADAIVLWCAATHALPSLPFAPRLSVRSATKRSGKSRVLEVVSALSHRPLKTVNATVPAIFRSLDGTHPPTLIFDEVDTIFGSRKVAENNEDLRGLLNAGFERGNPSIRCVGPMQIPTEFPSFAMAALAGIGSLPDTIEDRSVIVHMRRRKPSETVEHFRILRDRPQIQRLGAALGGWLTSEPAQQRLAGLEPISDLEDRQADVWESLLMIADLAGRDWPARARAAAQSLLGDAATDEQETSLPVRLLHDVLEAFYFIKSEFVPTEILLQHLKSMRESPWADMELTGHRLGRMLRDFGIKSTRDTTGTKRGYRRADFTDAWERYPPAQESEASESVKTHSEQAKQPDAFADTSHGATEVSAQVSRRVRTSTPQLPDSDTSDAHPGGNGCRDCTKPAPDWVLSERDDRCIRCDQDHRTGDSRAAG